MFSLLENVGRQLFTPNMNVFVQSQLCIVSTCTDTTLQGLIRLIFFA